VLLSADRANGAVLGIWFVFPSEAYAREQCTDAAREFIRFWSSVPGNKSLKSFPEAQTHRNFAVA